MECDSCGISVHESKNEVFFWLKDDGPFSVQSFKHGLILAIVCYGLSADNLSVSSGSGSSSQTEPWFCDVCKSGSENIFCELCPVEGTNIISYCLLKFSNISD